MAVKVSTFLKKAPEFRWRGLKIYDRLSKLETTHSGQRYIRELYEAFEISGPYGNHQCLVQAPMHLSVLDMLKSRREPFGLLLLKLTLLRLLEALDFLHGEAEIVHTGTPLLFCHIII